MAQPVTIKVDLDATPALNELAELEVLMKSIGHDFRDMDTGSITGDIQEMVSALEDAETRMNNFSREMKAAARAWDSMDFGDMPDSTGSAGGDSDGGGGSSHRGGGRGSNRDLKSTLRDLLGTTHVDLMEFSDRKLGGEPRRDDRGRFAEMSIPWYKDVKSSSVPTRDMNGNLTTRRMADLQSGIDFGNTRLSAAGSNNPMFGGDNSKARIMKSVRGMLDLDGDGSLSGGEWMGAFERKIKKMLPTMRKWWQLLALIIPLLIAAGVQALGVAAAFGAMAVAGASIIGLGLIGHADDMGTAFQRAKMEVRDFKREMFEVFSPTAQTFAPIQAEFMDFAPEQLYDTARAMEGLVVYSDLLFNTWSALAGGTEEFMNILVRNEAIVSQLTDRFGGLIGSGLLGFFEWLLKTAYGNQEVLIGLGAILLDLATIIYNVSMAVGRMLVIIEPLFAAFASLSGLLNNHMVMGLLGFMTFAIGTTYVVGKLALTVWGLTNALYMMYGMLIKVGSGSLLAGITAFFSTLWSYITATIIALWEMSAAAAIAATALAATGVGAIIVGAGLAGGSLMTSGTGPSGSSGYGGGGGGVVVNNYESNYNFESNGGMNNGREQRFRSQFKRMDGEMRAASTPNPSTGSSSSTTNGSN